MTKVVLVCGGRNYAKTVEQRWHMWNTLDRMHAHYGEIMLIVGGAPGADSYANVWADASTVHCAVVKALWNKLGPGAGPRRNKAMLALRPDLVLAFPGGPGTANMLKQARAAGIETYEV